MAKRAALVIERCLSLCIAAALLASGAAHAANPYLFLQAIHAYQLAPEAVAPWVAALLPQLQIVLAACMLCRVLERPALLISAMMFVVFASAQGVALYRGLKISCGCFGYSMEAISGLSLGAAMGLAASSMICASLLKDNPVPGLERNLSSPGYA
jgi:hypothetical protein